MCYSQAKYLPVSRAMRTSNLNLAFPQLAGRVKLMQSVLAEGVDHLQRPPCGIDAAGAAPIQWIFDGHEIPELMHQLGTD